MCEDFMNINNKIKIFTVLLLYLSAFSLHCKKAKELIEVAEKKKKVITRTKTS